MTVVPKGAAGASHLCGRQGVKGSQTPGHGGVQVCHVQAVIRSSCCRTLQCWGSPLSLALLLQLLLQWLTCFLLLSALQNLLSTALAPASFPSAAQRTVLALETWAQLPGSDFAGILFNELSAETIWKS